MNKESHKNSLLNWSEQNYIKMFAVLKNAEVVLEKLPVPGPSTLSLYRRAVAQVDSALGNGVTVDWAKIALRGYAAYKAGDKNWFETHLKQKPVPAPVQKPVAAKDAPCPVEIADLVAERLDKPLKALGSGVSDILRSQHRSLQEQQTSYNNNLRQAFDIKMNALAESILDGLKKAVIIELDGAVQESLGAIGEAIAKAAVDRLPSAITDMITQTVDKRIEQMFGPIELQDSGTSASAGVTEAESVKGQAEADSPVIEGLDVKPKRTLRRRKAVDEPLGSTDRPLKILILDLSKDQMSRTRNGINEKWAILDMGKDTDLTDDLVAQYDHVIGSHYTSKQIGKTAAATWPDKYHLANGNFAAVRTMAQRLINEFRQSIVVK